MYIKIDKKEKEEVNTLKVEKELSLLKVRLVEYLKKSCCILTDYPLYLIEPSRFDDKLSSFSYSRDLHEN